MPGENDPSVSATLAQTLSFAPAAAGVRPDPRLLYETEADYVWNALARLGIPERDCEDLAHDVFATAFRRLDSYDPRLPLQPWLFGICFKLANRFRRLVRHDREVRPEAIGGIDPSPAPDEAAATRQARQLVQRALQQLSEDWRAVFVMHELEEHVMPHIAEALEIPLNTAYSRLRLARADFATAVKQLSGGRE